MAETASGRDVARSKIVKGFGLVEDVAYVVLWVLLAAIALYLLANLVLRVAQGMLDGTLTGHVAVMLDRVLLTLLVIELLYTVQVSFREHAIVPEPFLLVALIAAVRHMLLLVAKYGEQHDKTYEALRGFAVELAVLTVLILALVVSLILLRRNEAIRTERS